MPVEPLHCGDKQGWIEVGTSLRKKAAYRNGRVTALTHRWRAPGRPGQVWKTATIEPTMPQDVLDFGHCPGCVNLACLAAGHHRSSYHA